MQYLLTKEEVEKLPSATATKMLIDFIEAMRPLIYRCLANTTMERRQVDSIVASVTQRMIEAAQRHGVDFADVEAAYKRMSETGK